MESEQCMVNNQYYANHYTQNMLAAILIFIKPIATHAH